jgi:hypothetical protein
VTTDDVIDLLTMIAAYDQRTVGEDDVRAWTLIARAENWTTPLAQRAVIEHHRANADRGRIRPAHITDTIRQARETIRRAVLTRDLQPPRELADNPRAEINWKRQTIHDTTEAALAAWASGQPLPQLTPERVQQITSGVPGRIRKLIGKAYTMPKDRPARAELDEIRNVAPPVPTEETP